MEFFTSLASEVVSKLGALVVDSTVKQFKYMICHNMIIADLKKEHKKLKAMRKALQGKVDSDRRNDLEIASDVEEWLRKVEDMDKELERFYEEEKASKNRKSSSGSGKFSYSKGKQATKKTQEIASLKEENKQFQVISYPKPQPRLGTFFTDDDIKALRSRKAIVKKVMEKLKDEKVKRIAICGMGGVGKTTLAKEVMKTAEASKMFDEFAIAAVSQNPDYAKMQTEIADMLGLKFKGESMQGRAVELHERVMKGVKTVLIVLDDIWGMIYLDRIGLPSLGQQQQQGGCKVLFTSRDKKACQSMKCDQENIIDVPVLCDPEDWLLFREMAGDVVDKPDIKDIAKDVAKECGGLPLALVVVARALANDEAKHVWMDALKQLRNCPSSSFPDMRELVHSRIEHSVNFLGSEEHKWCLWLCGLYPEDFDIPIESLLRHGMGMGMFKVDGALCEARNHLHTLILHLKRCFLLLDSGKPGCVKMHDVVRDVVISITSKVENGFMIQYNAKLKSTEERKLDHVKAISLVLDDTKELESDSEYPSLQLLQVRSKSKESNPWPEHFFQGMSKLKVLGMDNLSIIPPLPSLLFQAMANLQTLRIEYCDVGDISVIGKEFAKLQVLSFAYSNIEELPTQIGELGSLRLLDLTGCNDLCFISANVFKRLFLLEEFYFGVENFPWIHHKYVFEELQSLAYHIKVIEIKVRKVDVLPQHFTLKNLEKFWVYITPYYIHEQARREYLQPNLLQIAATNYTSLKNNSMTKELFKRCENLILEKVEGLKNVIYDLDGGENSFADLKDLRINSCHNLEYLFSGNCPPHAYSHIQSISLERLPNLREICNEVDHHNKKLMIQFSHLVKLELAFLPSFNGFSKGNDMASKLYQKILFHFLFVIRIFPTLFHL